MSELKPYVVLYRPEPVDGLHIPEAFMCQAEDGDHAEEQCEDAYPNCDIVWIVETHDPNEAYNDYWKEHA